MVSEDPGMINEICATQDLTLVAPGYAVRNQGEYTAESRRMHVIVVSGCISLTF